MIKLTDVVILDEDGEPNKELVNASYSFGINYIPLDHKEIFDVLSFSFVDIKSGTIEIDTSSISPKENEGSLFLLSVNCRDVVSLDAVFAYSDPKGTYEKRKTVGEAIAKLKEMAYYTEEEKMRKIDAVLKTLGEHGVSYILVNESDKTNSNHWGIVIDALERYANFTPSFILGKKAIPLPAPVVEDPNKEETKEIVVESPISSVTPSIPTITEKKKEDVPVDLDKANSPKELFRMIFKTNWVSVLLIFAFALLTSLGFMMMGALFTSGTHNTSGIVLAIISVIFFLDFVYSMSFIDLPKEKKKLLFLEGFNACLSLLGGGLGILICFLCAKGSFIITSADITTSVWITPLIFVVLMIAIPFLSTYIVKLVERIRELLTKKK